MQTIKPSSSANRTRKRKTLMDSSVLDADDDLWAATEQPQLLDAGGLLSSPPLDDDVMLLFARPAPMSPTLASSSSVSTPPPPPPANLWGTKDNLWTTNDNLRATNERLDSNEMLDTNDVLDNNDDLFVNDDVITTHVPRAPSAPPPPPPARLVLHPEQERVVELCIARITAQQADWPDWGGGVMIHGDVGTGKTATALELCVRLHHTKHVRSSSSCSDRSFRPTTAKRLRLNNNNADSHHRTTAQQATAHEEEEKRGAMHVTLAIVPVSVLGHWDREASRLRTCARSDGEVQPGFDGVLQYHGARRHDRFREWVLQHDDASNNTMPERGGDRAAPHLLVITSLQTFWCTPAPDVAHMLSLSDRIVIDEVQDLRNGGQYSQVTPDPKQGQGGKAVGLGHYAWLALQLESRPHLEVLQLTGTPVCRDRTDMRHELKLITRTSPLARCNALLGPLTKWQPSCSVSHFQAVEALLVIRLKGGEDKLDVRERVIRHKLSDSEVAAAVEMYHEVKKAGALYQEACTRHPFHSPIVQEAMRRYEGLKILYRRGLVHQSLYAPGPPPSPSAQAGDTHAIARPSTAAATSTGKAQPHKRRLTPQERREKQEQRERWLREKAEKKRKLTPQERREKQERRTRWLSEIKPEQSTRLVALADEIVLSSQRLAVFSEWTDVLVLLQRLLHQRTGLEFPMLVGGVSARKRDALVQAFNMSAHPRHRVLLLTSGAGGKGINLVAGRTAVLVNALVTAAAEDQALGRVVRTAAQGRSGTWWLWRCATTDDTATVENVYVAQAQRWKREQAEGKTDVQERASMLWAVPSVTLQEALERQALERRTHTSAVPSPSAAHPHGPSSSPSFSTSSSSSSSLSRRSSSSAPSSSTPSCSSSSPSCASTPVYVAEPHSDPTTTGPRPPPPGQRPRLVSTGQDKTQATRQLVVPRPGPIARERQKINHMQAPGPGRAAFQSLREAHQHQQQVLRAFAAAKPSHPPQPPPQMPPQQSHKPIAHRPRLPINSSLTRKRSSTRLLPPSITLPTHKLIALLTEIVQQDRQHRLAV